MCYPRKTLENLIKIVLRLKLEIAFSLFERLKSLEREEEADEEEEYLERARAERTFSRNIVKRKNTLSLRFVIDSFNAALKGHMNNDLPVIQIAAIHRQSIGEFDCAVPIKRTQFQVSGWI